MLPYESCAFLKYTILVILLVNVTSLTNFNRVMETPPYPQKHKKKKKVKPQKFKREITEREGSSYVMHTLEPRRGTERKHSLYQQRRGTTSSEVKDIEKKKKVRETHVKLKGS